MRAFLGQKYKGSEKGLIHGGMLHKGEVVKDKPTGKELKPRMLERNSDKD